MERIGTRAVSQVLDEAFGYMAANAHHLTMFFQDKVDTLCAFASEIYSMGYSATLFSKGNCSPSRFKYYGLNPDFLSDTQANAPAILCLHGDKGNQSCFLPLAKRLQGIASAVFTMNLGYDDDHPEIARTQLQNRIVEIKQRYQAKGKKHLDLIIIGHSKGAITGAEYAFCLETPKDIQVQKVISIAGRLRVWTNSWRQCPCPIASTVSGIYEQFRNKPTSSLHVISAEKDWLLPQEASKVGDNVYVVKRKSHLSVLFAQETHDKVIEIINK